MVQYLYALVVGAYAFTIALFCINSKSDDSIQFGSSNDIKIKFNYSRSFSRLIRMPRVLQMKNMFEL